MIKVHIRKHERGLWFRKGDLHRLAEPGTHWLWSRLWSPSRDRIEVVDTLKTRFEHPLLEALVKDQRLRSALEVIDLSDSDRALVWRDGRLYQSADGETHGANYNANSFSIRNAVSSAYFSDLETPSIRRWHSCPSRSAFSFILTP